MDLPRRLLHSRGVRRANGPLLLLILLWATPTAAHEGAELRNSALDQQIALMPTDPSPWLRRAEERRRQGDLKGAAADLERAADLGARLRPLALEQALLALAQGDHQRALLSLTAVGLDIDRDASLLEARAVARHALGQDGACADRLSALAVRPDTSRALAAEDFCIHRDPHSLRLALSTAERSLGLVPQLREALIRSSVATGDLDAARALATQLTEHEPNRVGGWLLAADVDEARGAPDEARVRRAAALNLAEERLRTRGTPLHRLAYAQALTASDRFEEAASQLEQVLLVAPGLTGAIELAHTLESR